MPADTHNEVYSDSIKQLMADGYPHDYAVAIAKAADPERPGTDRVVRIERQAPKDIDVSRCMTYDLISTGIPDRQGDILVSAGCDTSDHKLHPVILFNHGRSSDVFGQLPVGVAVDKSGNYGVTVEQDGVYSWTRYAQSSPFAMQLFALSAEGVLRGNSVAGDPVPGFTRELPRRKIYDGRLSRCFQHDKWVLREFSKTPAPVNQESLTILVEKGRANGERLHPILKSFLEPLCLTPTGLVNGHRFEKASAEEKHDEEVERDPKERPDPAAPLKTDGAPEIAPEIATETPAMTCKHCGGDHDEATCEKREKDKPAVEKALKPSLRVLAAAMQGARVYRAQLAKSVLDIEDEPTLSAVAEIDGYLEHVERACCDTMILKGVDAKDAPEVLTGDILKSQVADDKLAGVALKGYRLPDLRLIDVAKSITESAPLPIDAAEQARFRRTLTTAARRVGVA